MKTSASVQSYAFRREIAGEARRFLTPEFRLGFRKRKSFELFGSAVRVLADKEKIAVIRHQNRAVMREIFSDLFAFCNLLDIILRGLNFRTAAFRELPVTRLLFAALKL